MFDRVLNTTVFCLNSFKTEVPIKYRNQSIDLLCKSMGWFLYMIGTSVMKELNGKIASIPTYWYLPNTQKYIEMECRTLVLAIYIPFVFSLDFIWLTLYTSNKSLPPYSISLVGLQCSKKSIGNLVLVLRGLVIVFPCFSLFNISGWWILREKV